MSNSFDLAGLEKDFLTSCIDGVRYLAKSVTYSPFYAVSVYVDAYDGDFGFYANTEADFERRLRHYQEESPVEYADSYHVKELRYNCADWEYQGIVAADEFCRIVQRRIQHWSTLALQLIDSGDWFPVEENFLVEEVGCRIATSPALMSELQLLNRTSDFLVSVSGHDEPVLASVYRVMWYEENGTLRGFDPMAF